MATRVNCIYQSGERVAIAGCYEVAGAAHIQRALNAEDVFPCYDGRAVCWRLAEDVHTSAGMIQTVARGTRSRRIPFAQSRS
ncbi:MAG TPA: hypothetical protein VKQ72_11125 [Aggregatilineales bacterium]|nr:hypothetical protein [Aggregatilineales bacterium]